MSEATKIKTPGAYAVEAEQAADRAEALRDQFREARTYAEMERLAGLIREAADEAEIALDDLSDTLQVVGSASKQRAAEAFARADRAASFAEATLAGAPQSRY